MKSARNIKTLKKTETWASLRPNKLKQFSRTFKVACSLQKLPNMQIRISIYCLFFFLIKLWRYFLNNISKTILICTTFYFVVRRKSVRLTMTVVIRMEGQRGVNFLHMSVSRGRMRGLFRDHDPESQFILFKPLFVILSSSGKSGQTFPVIKQPVSNNAFPMLIYYIHTFASM